MTIERGFDEYCAKCESESIYAMRKQSQQKSQMKREIASHIAKSPRHNL